MDALCKSHSPAEHLLILWVGWNLETKIDWSWHASRGLDQILKNDTDLSEADRRITGTVQFYKIDNTIRVADCQTEGNILQTMIWTDTDQ